MKKYSKMLTKYKTIVENTLSLAVLNAVNMLLPLITLPYLIRTVGLANYGAYAVIYSILQYVLIISAYGFNYSTTKEISQNRENLNKVNKIVYATLYARFLISAIAISVVGCFVYLYYPDTYSISFFGGIGIIIGDTINPVWLYQGMEKMKYITIVNLSCKLLFTLLIFAFIQEKTDWIYITALYSCGYFISGILSLIISKNIFDIAFVSVKFSDVWKQAKNGWDVFLSTFFMNAYRNSNVFLLGFFVNEYNVGIYASGEKLIKAAQAIVSPISNALFPYMSRSFRSKKVEENAKMIFRIGKKLRLLFFLLIILLIVSSIPLCKLLLGEINKSFLSVICFLSPVIYFGGMNYILGIAGLVNMSYSNVFLRFVVISGCISLIVLLSTVAFVGIYSGVMAMLISECFLFILCYIKIKNFIKKTYVDS